MFLVAEKQKQLIMGLQQPERVLQAIPHAKLFDHEGKKLVAIPHRVEETKVLRNLGFTKAPSPILFHYDWPGHRVQPRQHQKATSAFLTLHRRGLCLNAPGTGKTLSALWAADFLLKQGVIKKILIVAPLSTLTPVWAKEIATHMPWLRFEVIAGTKHQKVRAINTSADIGIINHDGFTLLANQLTDYDLIIYDEATAVKSHSSKRFKTLYKFCDIHQPWLWLMTGTPISQHPSDAWTLAMLAYSTHVPTSFTNFKDKVMLKVGLHRWRPRPEAAAVCKHVLQPSICYSLDDCIELPQTNYLTRKCELTPEQVKAFQEMKEYAAIKLSDVYAPNAAVVFGKLLQICCGAAYNTSGDVVTFDAQDRVDTLLEIISEIDDKVIVYVPLRGVQNVLAGVLKKNNIDFASVHGDVSKNDRNAIFQAFQNTNQYQVLLAHPKVAAHGLTLTRAKDIIWYAPIYSMEQYEQANARIRRLTTEGKTRVHHIYATRFEENLYRRLEEKKLLLNELLDLVKGDNE
jgi:SNF2 family DNA or RNA helicase